MKTTTYEAVVENGQVYLPEDAYIPENTKVYVVVPSGEITSVRLASPRLAHREQAAAFAKEVEEEPEDGRI
jgi:hypothetical protein